MRHLLEGRPSARFRSRADVCSAVSVRPDAEHRGRGGKSPRASQSSWMAHLGFVQSRCAPFLSCYRVGLSEADLLQEIWIFDDESHAARPVTRNFALRNQQRALPHHHGRADSTPRRLLRNGQGCRDMPPVAVQAVYRLRSLHQTCVPHTPARQRSRRVAQAADCSQRIRDIRWPWQ